MFSSSSCAVSTAVSSFLFTITLYVSAYTMATRGHNFDCMKGTKLSKNLGLIFQVSMLV